MYSNVSLSREYVHFFLNDGTTFPKEGEDVTGWFMLYFVIHVLSSYHIVHGIPSFSFHYLITHAAPHFIYTRNLTCFEFPAVPG